MYKENIYIKKNKFGTGVYAKKSFKKGEIVWLLKGRKINPENYIFPSFETIDDVLQVGKESYIELEKISLRFNHSCNPNLALKGRRKLVAIHNIKEDEELYYDYSTTIDESFVCGCGSRNCRGAISDFFSLPKQLQKTYFKKKALPDFIIKKMIRLNKGKCPCGSKKNYSKCHGY